jgi:hypothetical protein
MSLSSCFELDREGSEGAPAIFTLRSAPAVFSLIDSTDKVMPCLWKNLLNRLLLPDSIEEQSQL